MADNIENQDVGLENNGGSEKSEKTEVPQKTARELELELSNRDKDGEIAKWKRIATRAKNQLDRDDEDKTESKPDDSALLQKLEKMALRTAGITHEEDVDLARKTAKKWGMDIDDVLSDEDFKVKLERQQTARANADATSNVKGNGNSSNAKGDAAYWIAKGVPPTAADVPDRKTRATIARALMNNAKDGGKFYNE